MVKYQVRLMRCSKSLSFGLWLNMLLRGEYAVDLLLLLDGDVALGYKLEVCNIVDGFFYVTVCFHLKLLAEMVIMKLFPLQHTN
jgi:hypothetical protein